jgi:putative phosphoesterase
MLRVAILADTHGHLDPRVAEVVAACDLAVHGGDIGNAGVLSALQPRQGRVIAVVGNNDMPRKWPAHERDRLAAVPEVAEVQLPGGTLVAIHGHQLPASTRHDRLRRRFGRARAVIYGHSHRLVADRAAEPWILNPGAAGRARTYGGPSCMILDASEVRWTLRVERFEALRRHPATPLHMPGKLQLSC